MQIVSSLLQPSDVGEVDGCALATFVDGRTLFVGVGRGSVAEVLDVAHLTQAAWDCIHVLRRHANHRRRKRKLRLVEIVNLDLLARHLCDVLREANDGDVVFFVCGGSEVVDAVWAALNVQRCPSPHTKQ